MWGTLPVTFPHCMNAQWSIWPLYFLSLFFFDKKYSSVKRLCSPFFPGKFHFDVDRDLPLPPPKKRNVCALRRSETGRQLGHPHLLLPFFRWWWRFFVSSLSFPFLSSFWWWMRYPRKRWPSRSLEGRRRSKRFVIYFGWVTLNKSCAESAGLPDLGLFEQSCIDER